LRSITDLPPRSAHARFTPDFGQRFLLTVDLPGDDAPELEVLAAFQRLCEEDGATPLYFAGAGAAGPQAMRAVLPAALATGRAELGVLYPERADPDRLERLIDELEQHFGAAPVIGRVAASNAEPPSPSVLIESGLGLDSSVHPNCDLSLVGGADLRRHPLHPYWLGEDRMLLELPQTTVFWGLLRRQGEWLHPLLARAPGWQRLAAWLGLLERITLSPQEADVEQAIRAIDIALDDRLPLLVLSCRLPDRAGFPGFADWWQRVLAYLELRRVPGTSVAALMRTVER